jgi:uncharacterized protein (TIGR02271 family)
MTHPTYDTRQLAGRTAVDRNYAKIGTISDVFVDDTSGRPEWLAVKTGLLGTKTSFVPLSGAHVYGDDVVVPYDASLVKDAPKAGDDEHLEPDEVLALADYYSTGDGRDRRDRRDRGAGRDLESRADDTMTRSEEEMDVQKRTRQSGRARLRKWIETEDVEIRVPVQREKVRVVTEPITDANRDDAMAGRDLSTDEHEVVLSEEVVDVDKRVVPKERVRLETESETDEVAIDDTVRKERIQLDHDEDTRSRSRHHR